MLNVLTQSFETEDQIKLLLQYLKKGITRQKIVGLTGSTKHVLMAMLFQKLKQPIVVVTPHLYSAQKIMEDLQELLPPEQILLYPANELVAAEAVVSSPEIIGQKLNTLLKCVQGFQGILIVPVAGMRKILTPPSFMGESCVSFALQDTLEMEEIIQKLIKLGYVRQEQVEKKGEMSIRGGIIDVFPFTTEYAFRIEFFGDEVDSIRTFEVDTQRSIASVEQITIPPCKEFLFDQQDAKKAAQLLKEHLHKHLESLSNTETKGRFKEEISKEIEFLEQGIYFDEIYKYGSLFYQDTYTLIDYFAKNTVVILDEANKVFETIHQLEKDELEWNTHLLTHGKYLPDVPYSMDVSELLEQSSFQMISMTLFSQGSQEDEICLHFSTRAMQEFHGQMNVLQAENKRWSLQGSKLIFLASDEQRKEHLKRILAEYEIHNFTFIQGQLTSGFEFASAGVVVVTEKELFSNPNRRHRKRIHNSSDNTERIKSYTELKIGDYVVHQNHGIGKYLGIGTLEINGIHKDYMHILYAGGDKLSVPVDQIELIQKYVGSEEKQPKIYKLGGNDWARVKNKVRASVKDIAEELIQLYAARQSAPGYAYEKDRNEQMEFEGTFPYDETEDQLRAILEIKQDMEKPQPMDRLLCGDVGYGKTEVAIRAAFKAAIEGKQVAMLVPTTILAHQHLETFQERFADYPINIGVLSRFRSRKEQNATIKGLTQGTLDVVIGTHRILSQDIIFKDLGLLIVDEEQRFGVTHKEKLKKLKTNVDVLTLTATPIPRTLHMSMLGVRDLSVIETPPENRFPVQTHVSEHNHALIREAIERELARGGQVYYLHNRIQGIEKVSEMIQQLVPDARIGVGHGKMAEQQLEQTILDFLGGEFDVLICTSIIETGVDIPNVNTLIVQDADKMGLSQLYQLRGRVGRSNRIAYAYFMYQKDKVLSEEAEKRLQSIKEFTELGSGFKIAMRDLAIRGAGNLLGAEQHGFIASVGFELYSQMLAEEVNKRKLEFHGQEAKEQDPAVFPAIQLHVDAYLPSEFIYDSMQKIEIYKKVAKIMTFEEVRDLMEELADRFGKLSLPVLNLLMVAKLKIYGKTYHAESIIQKKDEIVIKFPNQWEKSKLNFIAFQFERRMSIDYFTDHVLVRLRCKALKDEQTLTLIEEFFIKLEKISNSKGDEHDILIRK